MNRYGCNITNGIHIPDLAEQLFLGIYMIRMLGKKGQQIKFLTGKCLLLSINYDTSCGLVDTDTTDFNHIIILIGRANKTVVTCQMSLHSGNKLTRTKRLRHVIISSHTQSADLVNVLLLRRNHNNRNVLLFTNLLTYFKSVQSRKHEIQHNQIKLLTKCGL